MRHNQSTLKASTVHAFAQQLLKETLELENWQPSIPLNVVVSVLLLAACWQTSLTMACQMVKDKPSHRAVRKVITTCLPPKPRDLRARLLAALRQTLPEHLRVAPLVAAVDLHQHPFYGKKNTKGCTLRQKKKSTCKSFTYATLAVLSRWGRFTIGLVATRPHMRLTTIVSELLTQVEEAGIGIAYLMMDKGFYAAEVVALLQKRELPFLMPAVKTGNKDKGTGNAHLFELDTPVGWHSYTWTTPLRRMNFATGKQHKCGTISVSVAMCVARCVKDGNPEAMVYAAWGLGKQFSAGQIVQMYRRRFGIEASYRQLGQCLARTSARCERYRLLLVGVALLLCNLWAFLHSEVFATGPICERQFHHDALRLTALNAAIAAVVAASLGGWVDEWLTQLPVPLVLASLQT